jgi:hypothetical protein
VVLHDDSGQNLRPQNLCHNGEYRGATLFQIAQADPDYLRSLALNAQRPQVRAAAMQLVRALEASEPSPGRRRSTKQISRRHDR